MKPSNVLPKALQVTSREWWVSASSCHVSRSGPFALQDNGSIPIGARGMDGNGSRSLAGRKKSKKENHEAGYHLCDRT